MYASKPVASSRLLSVRREELKGRPHPVAKCYADPLQDHSLYPPKSPSRFTTHLINKPFLRVSDSPYSEEVRGGFNRSVQHDRFWVLSELEVHEWRDWVVLEGCRQRVRRSCGSGGGPGSPSAT